jgi:hypothetical protein
MLGVPPAIGFKGQERADTDDKKADPIGARLSVTFRPGKRPDLL